MGWTGMKNGKLLELAQMEFDIFITMDQNLPFQQPITQYSMAVIALKSSSNRYEDLLPFVEPLLLMIENCRSGKFYSVSL
jgi:hypothetical protein